MSAAACAPGRDETPAAWKQSPEVVLAGLRSIEKIDAAMTVVFEKPDSEMHGNAVLDVARNGDMHMKVYSLGILGIEITSKNGRVNSTPRLDRSRSVILTQGIRDSLFWWDLADAAVRQEEDLLILQNSNRQVMVDHKTMLPQKQIITFDDNRQLQVFYDSPMQADGLWYQSKMRIELSRYAVTLTVREITFAGLR